MMTEILNRGANENSARKLTKSSPKIEDLRGFSYYAVRGDQEV